jgi:hypothetical protein
MDRIGQSRETSSDTTDITDSSDKTQQDRGDLTAMTRLSIFPDTHKMTARTRPYGSTASTRQFWMDSGTQIWTC